MHDLKLLILSLIPTLFLACTSPQQESQRTLKGTPPKVGTAAAPSKVLSEWNGQSDLIPATWSLQDLN